jgi:exoribonuclease-2
MSVVNQGGSAARLVSELMIACGEALAAFGEQKNISLPYRGQSSREIPRDEIESFPEGPSRAIAIRRYLGRADMSFTKPIMHAALGVSGYVQFTSPIRRYSDLLAHYQVSVMCLF